MNHPAPLHLIFHKCDSFVLRSLHFPRCVSIPVFWFLSFFSRHTHVSARLIWCKKAHCKPNEREGDSLYILHPFRCCAPKAFFPNRWYIRSKAYRHGKPTNKHKTITSPRYFVFTARKLCNFYTGCVVFLNKTSVCCQNHEYSAI